jgi:hypothetical protein
VNKEISAEKALLSMLGLAWVDPYKGDRRLVVDVPAWADMPHIKSQLNVLN